MKYSQNLLSQKINKSNKKNNFPNNKKTKSIKVTYSKIINLQNQ